MKLADYFKILRRRIWIIGLLVVITAVSAYAFSKQQTPVYRATVQVSVNPARPELNLTSAAKILLRNYVVNMYSKTRAREVIERLAVDLTPDQLLANTTVASDDSRLTIQIDVKDYDPGQAEWIANEWAQVLVEWREQESANQRKEDQVKASRIDAATSGLFSPKTKINTAAGGVFGLLLAGVIIFFLEWIESGVFHSIADVERYLDLAILATIPSTKERNNSILAR
jgi:capsular polysaccharide biosynthesis protein